MRVPIALPSCTVLFGVVLLGAVLLGVGCGSAPAPRALVDDVFHDVYLRGAPSVGERGRVALTVDGPGPCTDRLLANAAEHGLLLTMMVDPGALEAAAERDRPALAATLARLDTDGHGLALAPRSLPADWDDPAAMRQGLVDGARTVEAVLTANGISPPSLRAWRPPSADAATLRAARAAERPLVLWSLRAPPGEAFDAALPDLLDRLTDGDIVALPAGESGRCPAADALPRLAAALAAGALDAVRLDTVLAPHTRRHDPPRVVRFRGPAPTAACLALAGVTPDAGEEPEAAAADARPEVAARWGLVHADGAHGVVVQPLPHRAEALADLFTARADIDRQWAARDAWAARPACLRNLALDELLSPLIASRGAGTVDWWVVEPESGRLERRDARALGRPGGPTLLPDRADLARFEARQRVPWAARGVVAGALETLDLDVPLLTELRSTVALVVAEPLQPDDADDEAKLRRAVGGFVPVAELSMGEYLFLAESLPGSAAPLQRTARAADGFLRPGPILVLAAPGRGPHARRLGFDGGAFSTSPIALMRAVLARGGRLAPGDVLALRTVDPRGAPLVFPTGEAESMAAALRTALSRSLLVAMMLPVYLRPGATRRFDGDLFGRWGLRVAVPAGVAAPATEVGPLGIPPAEDDPAASEADPDAPEAEPVEGAQP